MTRFQEGIEATAIIKESSKLVLPRLTTEDVNQERAEACCFENPVGSQTDWSLVCVCVCGTTEEIGNYLLLLGISFLLADLPCSSDGKESDYNTGDPASILGSGRSSGEGNGKPLWYSCLENPMERRAWRETVHGVAKSRTRLND